MVFYIIAFLDSRSKQEDTSGRKVREKFPNVPGARENNKLIDLKVRVQHFKLTCRSPSNHSRSVRSTNWWASTKTPPSWTSNLIKSAKSSSALLSILETSQMASWCSNPEMKSVSWGARLLWLTCLSEDYLQYIEQFSWNDLKFSSKKSLSELVAVITKVSSS